MINRSYIYQAWFYSIYKTGKNGEEIDAFNDDMGVIFFLHVNHYLYSVWQLNNSEVLNEVYKLYKKAAYDLVSRLAYQASYEACRLVMSSHKKYETIKEDSYINIPENRCVRYWIHDEITDMIIENPDNREYGHCVRTIVDSVCVTKDIYDGFIAIMER